MLSSRPVPSQTERSFPAGRVWLAGAAGRDPGRLAGLLGVDRRPRGVGQAVLLVAGGQVQQRRQVLRLVVHAEPRVAGRFQPYTQGRDRALRIVNIIELKTENVNR